jgi:hypothetical protein
MRKSEGLESAECWVMSAEFLPYRSGHTEARRTPTTPPHRQALR